MLTPQHVELEFFVAHLTTRTPFVFSRWGDGEWRAILGEAGENCDGHAYTGALRNDLTRVLVSQPSYFMGLQPFAVRELGPRIEAWLTRRHLAFNWMDADVLHRASIEDRLSPFLRALKRRHVFLVGPDYLTKLHAVKSAIQIHVPERNCYESFQAVLTLCRRALTSEATPDPVVLLSASMMSNLLAHQLSIDVPTATVIDCGSLWDPYVGKVTRRYHRAIVDRLASCA